MYRHGDLLVARVDAIPPDRRPLKHLVLAEGELTGHAHRILESDAATLYAVGEQLFLDVVGTSATLVHDEHGPISLPTGAYRVWRQREYSPREIRAIRD